MNGPASSRCAQVRRPFGRRAVCTLGVLTVTIAAGCSTFLEQSMPAQPPASHIQTRVKPVVAVVDFENRANFSGKWNLGSGMADVLTTQLLATDRFTVLEREHIDDVISELLRQGKDLFRKEGQVEKGRLKNAKYLVRGVVTDFTVTGDSSGWFGTKSVKVRGRGSRARVSVNIRVSDVETGEIISSVSSDKTVSSGLFGADVNYKDLSFGGDAFFQTPLGKATGGAIERALKKVMKDLPVEYWQPRIAEVGPDYVIINGGENVGLAENDVFEVREEGREVLDPVTGNIIESMPGRVIGRVRVTQVKPLAAYGILVEGRAEYGSHLEWVQYPERGN